VRPGRCNDLYSRRKELFPYLARPAAIRALYSLQTEQTAVANALGEELAALWATLDQADHGDTLVPWRRALDTR
jgi:hypothetical protein